MPVAAIMSRMQDAGHWHARIAGLVYTALQQSPWSSCTGWRLPTTPADCIAGLESSCLNLKAGLVAYAGPQPHNHPPGAPVGPITARSPTEAHNVHVRPWGVPTLSTRLCVSDIGGMRHRGLKGTTQLNGRPP